MSRYPILPPPGPPFQVIDQSRAYDGFVAVDVYHVRQQRFDGGLSPVLERTVVRANPAVAVLLYDPDREAIVLIEQARLPAGLMGFPGVQLELVAGLVEPGDDPLATARREVREETGCALVGEPVLIAHLLTSPGHSTEEVHFYCARVDSATAGGLHGLAAEQEDIRVRVLAYADFVAALADGRIGNGFTVLAGWWLVARRAVLRAGWGLDPE